MIQDRPIISTWGFGPSYRRRIKEQIKQAINSGYDKIMHYSILTDDIDDFAELADSTGIIVSLTNIHDIRKEFEWSVEYEHIPNSNDYENYGKEYVENLKVQKYFSYGLHRYNLLTLAKLGYTKILFMDSDQKINYEKIGTQFTEEQFWSEFDTPVNSMKGCVAERVGLLDNKETFATEFHWSRCMGVAVSKYALQLLSIVTYKLEELYNRNRFHLIQNYVQTEGPFRYYHFESAEKVKEYFDYWESAQKIIMTEPHLIGMLLSGGYMYCDYLPVSSANLYSKLTVLNFNNIIYDAQVYYEDRYFLPRFEDAALHIALTPANSVDEFFEKNEEALKQCLEHKVWPVKDPPHNYELNQIYDKYY